ncbi:MAG: hypothetical protein ACLPKB_09730 [Xanthobacteraceae bacterium]
MKAPTIVKLVKAFLQITMILISIGLVPIAVGLLGRSRVPSQIVTVLNPQMDRPVPQW